MSDVEDEQPETENEFARRVMFAYLSGIIKDEERAELKTYYEKWHAEHKEIDASFSACALCEIDKVMSMLF